ncbi:MAG: glycosyltransferase [Gomphosphaeria aponina SAG 52.96 = DSM 107014]|uniref:Glycosyltransferase n=1 Tax=Gomphosphaeria aponina SAG 52.96 = DSM 107014 TaxID=1521640 RepID=A0A941JNP3_9CHRO|nr:glycosyltransferase [Gomphosphaeria aponina SAG 52.96 = DSM 107014]
MTILIEIILLLIAGVLLVPSVVLLIECLAALFPFPADTIGERPSSIAVLVPAHNESAGIARTLKSILPQLNSGDRLITIADNCTDETAAIARKLEGVSVIERENPDLRGKGYAVDFGLRYLESQPPDVVVMVDADCIVEENTIDRIARVAWKNTRPVQGIYLMDVPPNPTPKDAVSALALVVKNSVRQVGLARLGLPCLLTGSGMAFPWEIINQVSFANSKTVDDMQLGLDLAIAGYPPLHCHSGQVTGRLMEQQFAKSQRSRWEHGHIETILTETPRLLRAAFRQKRWDLVAIALELFIPPLSLFLIFWLFATGSALLATTIGVSFIPFIIFAWVGILIFLAIFIAWAKFGRNNISLVTLLSAPFYVLWKFPLYLAFFFQRQSRWTKTERDAG